MKTDDARRKALAGIIDEVLRTARYNGVTAGHVAKALGVNPATVSTWRNEKRRALPSRDNLAKLARFLNLPLDHFDVEAPSTPAVTPENVDDVAIDARERIALLDALARESARADRYHEILLREVDATPTELVLDDVEKRFFAALAEQSKDPSAYALAKRVWASVIATAAVDRSKARAN